MQSSNQLNFEIAIANLPIIYIYATTSLKQDQLGVSEGTGEDFRAKSRLNVSSELTFSPIESSTNGTPYQPESLILPQSTSSRTVTMPSSRPQPPNWLTSQFYYSNLIFIYIRINFSIQQYKQFTLNYS